ncbi:putative phage abortive infection protein [Proteus terrae]|uniref:putative phage abortive infection protein n=1 Tax=Proteus terrae TaxID=1574161 RepID=UPI003525FC33
MWRFLVGLIFIGMCAGIYLWTFYDSKKINIIELYTGMGVIFSSIAAMATVFVFRSTAQATKNAIKSVEIAEKNLRESREYNKETLKIAEASLQSSLESSRKDDFIKHFSLLLEQHNKLHQKLASYIDLFGDKKESKFISENKKGSIIQWNMPIENASDKLYQEHNFAPYMIALYRLLKHIDENFYKKSKDKNDFVKEKKEYSNIIRSVIRNDILFLVAINAKNKRNIFRKYEDKLIKFDFFKYLITEKVSSNIIFNKAIYIKTFRESIKSIIEYYINKNVYVDCFFFTDKNLFKGREVLPLNISISIVQSFIDWKFSLFKDEIEKIINEEVSYALKCYNYNLTYNDILYFYQGELNTNDKYECITNANYKLIKKINISDIADFDTLKEYSDFFSSIKNRSGNVFFSIDKYEDGIEGNKVFLYISKVDEIMNSIRFNLFRNFINKDNGNIKIISHVLNELNKSELIINMGKRFFLNENNQIVLENKNN